MTITEVATATVAVLSPYLAEGGKELAKTATKELWNWIKGVFKGRKEEKQIAEFEQMPNDPKVQGKIELLLENLLEENNHLIAELQRLIANAKGEIISNTTGNIKVEHNEFKNKGDVIIGGIKNGK